MKNRWPWRNGSLWYNTGDCRPNSTLRQQHDRHIMIHLQHKNVQPFNIPTLPTQSTFEDHTTKWWDKILTIIIWIPPKKTQNVLLRLILFLSHTHRYPGPKAGQGDGGWRQLGDAALSDTMIDYHVQSPGFNPRTTWLRFGGGAQLNTQGSRGRGTSRSSRLCIN